MLRQQCGHPCGLTHIEYPFIHGPLEDCAAASRLQFRQLEETLKRQVVPFAAEIQTEARLTSKPLADVTAVCSALIKLCKHAAAAPKPAPPAHTLETPVPIVGLPAPIGDPLAGSGPSAVAAPAAVAPFKTAVELDVPADARKAFDAGKFRERIAKNAQK